MKIFRSFILFALVLTGLCASAQKKELSLQEVMLYPAKFSPQRYYNPVFSPIGTQWASYNIPTASIVIESVSGNKKTITAEKISKDISQTLSRIPVSYSWKDADNLILTAPDKLIQYTLSTDQAKTILNWESGLIGVQISPSFDAVVFSKDNNIFYKRGDKITQISTDGSEDIVYGQTVHRNEFGIDRGIFFSPKGNKIAYYRKDESMVAKYPLVNTSTRIATVKNIPYPMAGEASEQVTLHLYNPTTGSTIQIAKQGAKDDYLTAITWDPSENFIYVGELSRDQKNLNFNKFDANTGAFIKTLFSEKSDRFVEPEQGALFIPNRPNEFLWRSELDGNIHYYRYDTEGRSLGRVTSGSNQVESIVGLTTDCLYYISTAEYGMDRTIKYANFKTGKTDFIKSESGTYTAVADPTGRYIISTFSNLGTPGVTELISTKDAKTIRTLLKAANPLQDYKIGTVRLGHFMKDNIRYNTRMVLPSNFDPTKRYPVLVYVYGGPHLQMVRNTFRGSADLWMHYLAEQGYIIFTMDNRGTPARGFEWESAIHRQAGKLEVEDQMHGIEFLKNQSYVYPERIAVYGWSYGGFMATSLMLKNPKTFSVAVAGGPVIDWKWYEAMYTERYMDTPQDNPAGYAEASLLDKIPALKGKLMLIHGTDDPVVLWQHSQELVRQAVNSGKQIDYMIYPGHEHNVLGKDRLHLIEKILNYIQENNR